MPDTHNARQRAKETLFKSLYGQLHQQVYEYQPSLLFGDADTILALLAEQLPKYKGRLTPDAFLNWALPFIERHAKRLADTAAIFANNKNQAYIRKAIVNAMPFGTFDATPNRTINGESLSDIAQEVAIRILAEADDLSTLKPGDTAKQSTRVYSIAKRHTELYYSIPHKRRRQLLLARIQNGDEPYVDTEVWSDQEWAELRAMESDEAA